MRHRNPAPDFRTSEFVCDDRLTLFKRATCRDSKSGGIPESLQKQQYCAGICIIRQKFCDLPHTDITFVSHGYKLGEAEATRLRP